jgi:SAM-dependent methyltransferase
MHNNDLNLDSRFSWAIERVKNLKKSNPQFQNIFDVGAGSELLKNEVIKLGMNYYSFDLFPPNDNVRKWDIEQSFPYEGTADIVIFLEVVEHLNNPGLSLKNISNVINDNGYLILSTPNPSWSGSRLHLLGKGFLGMFTEQDLILNHHVFTPWQHIVKYLLSENGFLNIDIYTLGKKTSIIAYPFWGLKMPFRIIFRLVKKIIERMDSQAIGALYGVLAQKNNTYANK